MEEHGSSIVSDFPHKDNYESSSTENVEEIEKKSKEIEEELSLVKNETAANKTAGNPPGSAHTDDFTRRHDFTRHRPLFDAVGCGDWIAANMYLDKHPDAARARIIRSGKTPLFIAVGAGHLHIVEKLLQLLTEEDLLMKRSDGYTVLAVAVEIGNIGIAECLIRKNNKLVSFSNDVFGIPVVHAVCYGFHEMARYLYSVTPQEELTLPNNGSTGSDLICQCLYRKQLDIPMDLLERCPGLAITAGHKSKRTPVWALACCEFLFPSGCKLGFLQRWVYKCILVDSCAKKEISIDVQNPENNKRDENNFTAIRPVLVAILARMPSTLLKLLDVKHVYETKLVHVQSRQLLCRMCKVIKASDENEIHDAKVDMAVLEAAYNGNVELIKKIAKANAELVWTPKLARDVFMRAIELRQAQVFSLIYGLPKTEAIANGAFDLSPRDNMLHEAALLPSSKQLNLLQGAALQMQRELQWFKEVETIASTSYHLPVNKDKLHPRALFTKKHEKLASDGEKWMKETSSSCIVVGSLIATITFAAAFTFPGGNNQNTGFPLLSNNMFFKVFIITDAISLFSSTTSVLMFLGILTSRYKEEDFLKSLPTKMVVGLSVLLISMGTMLTAFSATFFIVLQDKWIAYLISSIASVPVAVFVWTHFHLLVEI